MNTRLLFGLLWLTPTLCFGALSTTTSYFLNVEALTNVTARGSVVAQKSFQPYFGVLTHAGTITLNLDDTQTCKRVALTGTPTIATSNLQTNRTYWLRMTAPSTNCANPVFPAWNFMSGMPSVLTANKVSNLRLVAHGTADSDVDAWFEEAQ